LGGRRNIDEDPRRDPLVRQRLVAGEEGLADVLPGGPVEAAVDALFLPPRPGPPPLRPLGSVGQLVPGTYGVERGRSRPRWTPRVHRTWNHEEEAATADGGDALDVVPAKPAKPACPHRPTLHKPLHILRPRSGCNAIGGTRFMSGYRGTSPV